MRSVVKIQHNLVILPKYGHATSKCGHIILNVTFIYIYTYLHLSITILRSLGFFVCLFFYVNYHSATSSYIWMRFSKSKKIRCVTGAEHRAFGVKQARIRGFIGLLCDLKTQHFEHHIGFEPCSSLPRSLRTLVLFSNTLTSSNTR